MTRWIVLGVGLALAGCIGQTEPGHADWHGDSRFTADERAAIVAGEAWLATHAGRAPATFDWSYDAADPLESHEAHTIRRERGPSGSTGECVGFAEHVGDGMTVYLDPIGRPGDDFRPADLPGLAAHEMAHCELGFVDGYRASDERSDGIMRILYPMAWTASEDAQLARTTR